MSALVAEVSLDALRQNIQILRSVAANKTLGGVVKANGYGHGAVPVARLLKSEGVPWIFTATLDEAVALRDAGIQGRLAAFVFPNLAELPEARSHQVTLVCGAIWQLELLERSANRAAQRPAHTVILELDTGMRRSGATPDDWPPICARAAATHARGSVHVLGVMSHLARADEPDLGPSLAQDLLFRRGVALASREGLPTEVVSLCNSAGTLAQLGRPGDLVRCGLALYGFSARTTSEPLHPVMTLRSQVLNVRTLKAGEGVSYGHQWVAVGPTRVATVFGGYADGVPAATNLEVSIGQRRCPVRGAVNMDQFVVEVSEDVGPGAHVTLFGDPSSGAPSITEWSKAANCSVYELLTRVGGRTRIQVSRSASAAP